MASVAVEVPKDTKFAMVVVEPDSRVVVVA
jgi:hypothetical protein